MPQRMSRYHLLYLVLLRAKLRKHQHSGRPLLLVPLKKRRRHPSFAFLKNFARLSLQNLNPLRTRRGIGSSSLNRKGNN